MKTFEVVKSYFAAADINSNQQTQFTTRSALFILMLSLNLASTCIYSFQAVDKFEDYVDSFYWISTTLANVFVLTAFLRAKPLLYRFLTDLEDTITNRKENSSEMKIALPILLTLLLIFVFIKGLTNSESRTLHELLYNKTDEKAAKWINIFDISLAKITPILDVLPKFIASFTAYFTTDAGSESFELPTPQW